MNEKETTEAWQTKPGDMNASIDRMMADLATIESLIRTTRSLVEGAEDGAFKWATLSKAIGDIRHVLGPCTFMPDECFHKVCEFASGKGAFHTPKEILDFVTANPPIGDCRGCAARARWRASGAGARFRWRKAGTSTRFQSASARSCAASAPSARGGRRNGRQRA